MTNREAERRALRKAGILDRQRYRRWHKRRIDYYPAPAAAAVIDAVNACGLSAAIDKLILVASELPEFRHSVKSGG